jgi:hypothetical protein
VIPPAPVDLSPPAIAGTAGLGQLLTESHGSWSNAPTGYTYQWEDCDSAGNNCFATAGATGQTHLLTVADVGHTLRVTETASNAAGPGSPAVSAATPAVSAAILAVPVAPSAPASGAPPSISGTGTVPGSPAGGTSPHKAAPSMRLIFEQISSKDHSAKFRFKAAAGAQRIECALVRKPTRRGAKTPSPSYSKCGSAKTFSYLKAGSYVLYVRAVGSGGVHASPVRYSFKIA